MLLKKVGLAILICLALTYQVHGDTFYCGSDPSGTGSITNQGDLAQCTVTVSGSLICPLDATNCVPKTYDATCPANTQLNTTTNECEGIPASTCASSYSYVDTDNVCFVAVECPDGSSFKADSDVCQRNTDFGCNSPYSYNGDRSRCEVAPDCTPGQYNTTTDRCETQVTVTCPGTLTDNAQTGICQALPSCPAGGAYDSATHQCEVAGINVTTYACSLTGTQYDTQQDCTNACSSSSSCTASEPTITVSGSFTGNGTGGVWWALEAVYTSGNELVFYCYDENMDPYYCGAITVSGGVFFTGGIANAGGITGVAASSASMINVTTDYAGAGSISVSGATVTGAVPGDIGGAYGSGNTLRFYCVESTCTDWYQCWNDETQAWDECCDESYEYLADCGYAITFTGSTTYTCPYGTQYACDTSHNCTENGTCTSNTQKTCPTGYTWNGTLCIAAPSCGGGTLNTGDNTCEAQPVVSCASGWTYDSGNVLCYKAATCPQGTLDNANDVCCRPSSSYCETGFSYNNTSGYCELAAQTLCQTGDSYSTTLHGCTEPPIEDCSSIMGAVYTAATNTCDADPTCATGVYSSATQKCVDNTDMVCPLDESIGCVLNGTVLQCSALLCTDPTAPGNETITQNNNTMLTNDGARDDEGNCLGEIYIFSGRSMECNTSGMDSGWKNCCLSGEATLGEDVGNAQSMNMEMAGIKAVYEMGQLAAFYYGASGSITITSSSSAALEAGVQALDATESLMDGFEAYAEAAMLNPATIAIAAAMYLAQEVFLSGQCKQEDLETSMSNDAGRCHYIGNYCEKKWALIGCVQQANVYCCFNSKLARIVQEQGRPQLKTFNPLWATFYDNEISANCRGFTPGEFQMLDFSKMNLSEYFNEITTTAQSSLQQTINSNIQQYYQSTHQQP